MTFNLKKIALDQKAVFIDEVGNEIPVYHKDFSAKCLLYQDLYNPGPWIDCLDEFTFCPGKILLYKKIYGVISQRDTEEIRKGFFVSDLERFLGRIPIELYT